MQLIELKLEQFRSYKHFTLELDPKKPITIFVGENAQGKTNLLEAIALLAIPKSFRTRHHRDLILFEENYFRIHGTFVKNQKMKGVECHNNDKKYFQLSDRGDLDGGNDSADDSKDNNEPEVHDLEMFFQQKPKHLKRFLSKGKAQTLMEFIGNVRMVLFSPETMNLMALGPAMRRKFLNGTLCQLDRAYLEQLLKYQKALKSRNILLKKIHEKKAKLEELEYWNETLVFTGTYIIRKRHAMLDFLQKEIREFYALLSEKKVVIQAMYENQMYENQLIYKRKLMEKKVIHEKLTKDIKMMNDTMAKSMKENGAGDSEQDFERNDDDRHLYRKILNSHLERDLLQMKTTFGPHIDDIVFCMNGREMERVASRGEHRLLMLALKLAEMRYIEHFSGQKPLLLLDDVFSELDSLKKKRLLQLLTPYQTIITSTEIPEDIDAEATNIYRIHQGGVERSG